jgi:hypothetical protein
MQLPLEARDFGMYGGFLATWGYIVATGRGRAKNMPPWYLLFTMIIFVAIMGFDGINAFLYDLKFVPHLYTPMLELRLATGLLCGVAFGGIMVPVVNMTLWKEDDLRPVIENWKELFIILGLMVILYILNFSGWGLLFWPLAIVTSGSTVILIALINMVFVISLARKECTAVTLRDALNPFAVGVALSIIELGGLSLLRYLVLGTMVLP